MTGLALGELWHLDLHRVAEDGLRELELDVVAQVGTTEHLRAAAAARRSEDIAEHIAENIAEGIAGAEAPRPPASLRRGGLHSGVAVLVVRRPLLRVGEHLARLLRLLEALLGLLVVGIAVGVILHGEAAISLFDLRLGGRPGYVEYLVVISF